MLRPLSRQASFHSILYNKIPENHILKQINSVLDFSFINDLLEDSYCKSFGRPAKEPEMMCKLLILQHLYNLSDERVIQEANLNLAYMFFLGLNPEDALPNKSLLAKFRCHRLKEITLDEIIIEIVRQCVDNGIIKDTSVSIDATHIHANTIKKTPERLMKHLSRKILNTYKEETSIDIKDIPSEPDYTIIDNHKEAKEVMRTYLDDVIEKANKETSNLIPRTKDSIQEAQEIVNNPKFMVQKGCRSIVDKDARVGRKSKHDNFYGYKTEFVMTTDERIITSIKTRDGAYTDGDLICEMLNDTLEGNLEIKEVYGDKAYFRKPILDKIESINAIPYIPVSAVVYRLDESQFTYNKDSDEWICKQGNRTKKKKRYKSKAKNCRSGFREGYKYYFEIKQCRECPIRSDCAKKSSRKILNIGLNTAEFYEISQFQQTDNFKEKYKKRASIEGKNAELKRFHGLYRARGYGLVSVSKQSKLTAIAVNIKRIARIISSLTTLKSHENQCKLDIFIILLIF